MAHSGGRGIAVLRLCTGRTAHSGGRGIAVLRLCTGRTAHRGSRGIALLRLCTGRTAHRGSRVIALLFHDHGTRRRWGLSFTLRPLFTSGKDTVPIVQEAGWVPWPVGAGMENLDPTGIWFPDRPARSQSLYRLSYPAHKFQIVVLNLRKVCILVWKIQEQGSIIFFGKKKCLRVKH